MWIRKNLVTIDIFYYIPDYDNIVQEFVWQTEDVVPEFPRVHRFLNFWKKDIDAVIQEVILCYSEQTIVRNVRLHNYNG